MRLQSFADFPADRPAVQVIDIDAVVLDGTLVPENPARATTLKTLKACKARCPRHQPRP
jgi:hypothetical protein